MSELVFRQPCEHGFWVVPSYHRLPDGSQCDGGSEIVLDPDKVLFWGVLPGSSIQVPPISVADVLAVLEETQ